MEATNLTLTDQLPLAAAALSGDSLPITNQNQSSLADPNNNTWLYDGGDFNKQLSIDPDYATNVIERLEQRPVMTINGYDWSSEELLGKSRCTKCAQVVRVRRMRDKKTVAVRKISSPIKPLPRDSLVALDEARKLYDLPHHNNLVRVNAIFSDGDFLYVETDYYEVTLNARIQKHFELRGAFPQSQLIRYMHQLTKAVRFLNDRGILHRDIRPKNIYVIKYDDSIKLGDYGAPKIYQNRSHASRYAGAFWFRDDGLSNPKRLHCCMSPTSSWPYMPPEMMCELFRPKTAANTHIRHDNYTARSEAWSLGIVFYEMLALKVPFPGRTIKQVEKAIQQAPFPIDSIPAVRKYSPKLMNFVARLLCQNPDERMNLNALEQELGKLKQRSDVLKLSTSGGSEDLQKMFEDEKNVNLNVKDADGFTPLMRACTLGHVDLASLLLRKGADTYAVSKSGWTLDDCIEANSDADDRFALRELLASRRLLFTGSNFTSGSHHYHHQHPNTLLLSSNKRQA